MYHYLCLFIQLRFYLYRYCHMLLVYRNIHIRHYQPFQITLLFSITLTVSFSPHASFSRALSYARTSHFRIFFHDAFHSSFGIQRLRLRFFSQQTYSQAVSRPHWLVHIYLFAIQLSKVFSIFYFHILCTLSYFMYIFMLAQSFLTSHISLPTHSAHSPSLQILIHINTTFYSLTQHPHH